MDDSAGWDERKKALQDHMDEVRRQQRDDQVERRNALRAQIDEMKRLQRDEQQERRQAIEAQVEELRRLHQEQQEKQRALMEQIREMKRQERDEQREEKKTLREQIADKMCQAQDDHIRKHHLNRGADFEFLQDLGDNDVRKGFLKLHILIVLSVGPSHGYEIMHRIEHHSGHPWHPSPGSVYPALESLESKGFIACQGDGRRKVYSLTPKGQDVIDQLRKKREEQFAEMKAFMSRLFEE